MQRQMLTPIYLDMQQLTIRTITSLGPKISRKETGIKAFSKLYVQYYVLALSSEVITSTHSFAYSYRLVKSNVL